MTLPDFKLHSKGENWWHFRRDLNNFNESFTVTLVHDGTVVLTGDYGVLAFQRTCFPESIKELIGFPNEKTDLNYFAEKVSITLGRKFIEEWDSDKAEEDIKKWILSYNYHTDPEHELDFDDVSSFESEEEMLKALDDWFEDGDWWECRFEWKFTNQFERQFEYFKVWTRYVMQEETVKPFSCGGDYGMWKINNCDKCKKYNDDIKKTCPLDYALGSAYLLSGLITREVAERLGVKTETPIWLCKEKETAA